jgi:hypothetical protein
MRALRSILIIGTSTLLLSACGTGLVGGEQDQEWDDDAEQGERSTMFKHPPPSTSAPWTYVLTSYGGSNDKSTYNKSPACGGKVVDGSWWYATGAWSFGCNSKLELRANGKCAVVQVVDNGPASWVEQKVKGKCGGTGYVIDASPRVSQHLFGTSSAGWSDCMQIQVTPVSASTPTGPCSSSGGTPPLDPSCHAGAAPFAWDYCSPSCPCGAGQGDCDSDADCNPGLRCEHNTGAQHGAGSTVDICTAGAPTPQPGGTCHPGFIMEWNYCNPSCPCGVGEGDCDSDADCQPGLHCAQDVGGKYGTANNVDVCEQQAAPPPASPGGGGGCDYAGGTNYRKCRGCGWQFCMSSGTWSTSCAPKASVFPCPQGTSCGGDAWCH